MINHQQTEPIDLSSIDQAPSQSTNTVSDTRDAEATEDTAVESSPDVGDSSPDDSEAATDQDETPGFELPLDLLFEILKNNRRRQTIRFLRDNGGETTLSDAAEHIAALENDTTVKAITSSERKRVYVGLYQCHLPKMDDADIIDFDQNRGTIKIGPNADQLDPYLQDDESIPFHKIYLGIALGGSVLFAASVLGGAAVGLTSTVVLGILLAGIIACVVAHYSLS